MREIVFRGKTEVTGCWIYGCLGRNTATGAAQILPEGHCSYSLVIPETVGQYTGLTDKNGKKIFEGDIMTFEAYGFKYIGIVQIIDGVATILCDNQISPTASPFLYDAIKRYNAIIIGNIHDNPELLKGGEEE